MDIFVIAYNAKDHDAPVVLCPAHLADVDVIGSHAGNKRQLTTLGLACKHALRIGLSQISQPRCSGGQC